MSTTASRIPGCASAMVLALGGVLGCGSEVGGGSPSDGGCDPASAPELQELRLHSPTTGALVGGVLHLSASLDWTQSSYVILEIQGDAAFLVDAPLDLDGPANLAPLGPGRHARLRASPGWWVDIIDTSDPRAPVPVSSRLITGEVPSAWQTVFSVVDGHVLACVRS